MDIKEYISSGILELYAAGGLSERENKDVESMTHSHPEIKTELEIIQKTYEHYASVHKVKPKLELKYKIVEKINSLETQKSDKNILKKYLIAAVILLVLTNLFSNFLLYNKISKLSLENEQIRAEYQQIKNSLEKRTQDLMVVSSRKNKVVEMKGLDISPSSFSVVYWNFQTKQIYLNAENLPIPPPNKQYQLWAIADGKPIDAGVFEISDGVLDIHVMKKIESAEAFAITLEPKGGSPSPTLEAMYVFGKL